MRIKLILAIIIILLACKSPEDFENLCDPPYLFEEKNKDLVNIDVIIDNVFEPYCAPCHSTKFYQDLNTRRGYLPLDREILTLKNDFNFKSTLAGYINFSSPEDSKLIKLLTEVGVDRTGVDGKILYREPRNRCEMPPDVLQGIKWWIDNADGSIDKLLN